MLHVFGDVTVHLYSICLHSVPLLFVALLTAGEKRNVYRKKHKLAQSMDDSSVETLDKNTGQRLRRHESETDLLKSTSATKDKGTSKQSLIDRFADVSKLLSEKQAKRAKSPFSIFKKPKTRDQGGMQINPMPSSIPAKVQMSSSEYSEDEESQDIELGPTISISHAPHMPGAQPGGMKKSASMASYGSELDSEPEAQELLSNLDVIDEYYYGVRIFPGQDPGQIYIGWVTPQFHIHQGEFDMKKVRNVVVCSLDVDYRIKSRYGAFHLWDGHAQARNKISI